MKKLHLAKAKLFLGLGVMLGLLFLQDNRAFAAGMGGPVTVDTVDFEEEEIVVNNNGNSRIYFATEIDAGRGNWEQIPADVNAEDVTRIDFSWVTSTADNVIKIKGGDDPDSIQARVVLPKKTTKLEISINYSNINSLDKTDSIAPLLNIMTTAGTGAQPITFSDLEWKKGEGGKWKAFNELTVEQLEKFQIKGTDLFFRIKAVNDETRVVGGAAIYPDGSKGRRASNEVRVKIAKKATAVVVGIDGSRFTADINYGKEYRASIGSNRTDWIKVLDRSTKKLDLGEVIGKLYADPNDIPDGITEPFPEMRLEIREYATSKAAASKITEINLNEQRVLNDSLLVAGPAPKGAPASDQRIYVSYNGDKNIVITIPSASADNPYEYCIIKAGDKLVLNKAVWSAITKPADVKVLKSKALDNATLYIRKKEIKSRAATKTTAAVAYALASTVVSHEIKYPNAPVIEKGSYTFVKDMDLDSNKIEFNIKLNAAGRDAYETELRSIKLGTRDIVYSVKYTPEINESSPFDKTNAYIMTVTLDQTSLKNTPNCTNKALTITFMNGTVDKTSIILTVKNPTKALALTASASAGAVGKTKVTVSTSLGKNNAYCYLITSDSMADKVFVEDMISNYPAAQPFSSGDEITVAENTYLTIIEYNTVTGHFVKYKTIPVTSQIIGK